MTDDNRKQTITQIAQRKRIIGLGDVKSVCQSDDHARRLLDDLVKERVLIRLNYGFMLRIEPPIDKTLVSLSSSRIETELCIILAREGECTIESASNELKLTKKNRFGARVVEQVLDVWHARGLLHYDPRNQAYVLDPAKMSVYLQQQQQLCESTLSNIKNIRAQLQPRAAVPFTPPSKRWSWRKKHDESKAWVAVK